MNITEEQIREYQLASYAYNDASGELRSSTGFGNSFISVWDSKETQLESLAAARRLIEKRQADIKKLEEHMQIMEGLIKAGAFEATKEAIAKAAA